MKITIESTSKIVTFNGIDCRVWEGKTASGIEIHAFISRIGVKEGQPVETYEEFERELKEVRKPSALIAAIPARMLL